MNEASVSARPMYNSNMALLQARLNTFKNWPNSKRQKADLAKCGFYYLGETDKVRCFYCGVGLNDWICEDNVWLEHAINSNRCKFLILNKKRAFQENPDQRFPNVMVIRHRFTNSFVYSKNLVIRLMQYFYSFA
jgi:hypothetical protein